MLSEVTDRAVEDMAIFHKLQSSPLQFHLTGSFFCGQPRAGSDVDFFVQGPLAAPERKWLADLGFKTPEYYSDYHDSQCLGVLVRKANTPIGKDIHIQIVKDATVKLAAQKLLAIMFPEGSWTDSVWEGAFRVAMVMGADMEKLTQLKFQ